MDNSVDQGQQRLGSSLTLCLLFCCRVLIGVGLTPRQTPHYGCTASAHALACVAKSICWSLVLHCYEGNSRVRAHHLPSEAHSYSVQSLHTARSVDSSTPLTRRWVVFRYDDQKQKRDAPRPSSHEESSRFIKAFLATPRIACGRVRLHLCSTLWVWVCLVVLARTELESKPRRSEFDT